MYWLGVDVGGTFTDLVLYNTQNGELRIEKVGSTLENQALGILSGIDSLGISSSLITKIAHGTTVATNIALERNGARLAVVTTRGFRDVLIVGRGNRFKMYDPRVGRPPALISRVDIEEVDERVAADGQVVRPVDIEGLSGIVERLKARNVEAVAVCLLHSCKNDAHERTLRDALSAQLPGVFVSSSAGVLDEAREYERFSTTALNAYVAPAMQKYLSSLNQRLLAAGFAGSLTIMTSNGGTASVERLVSVPVASMVSGPAAGVTGAAFWSDRCGLGDLITYDMGGTSTDVCLIEDGRLTLAGESMVSGLVNRSPQIELNTVGAGGGSIASVNAEGFLSVGPESAGSYPGPACYGRGGEKATVTDANLALGRLADGEILGRDVALSKARAMAVLQPPADALGVTCEEMAEGIVRLAVVKSVGAIREISIMRGHDPHDFSLFAYGGAGPMHAALVADELGCSRVIIPPHPGNFSAFGLLTARGKAEAAFQLAKSISALNDNDLRDLVTSLTAKAREKIERDETGFTGLLPTITLDIRYVGQASPLHIEIGAQELALTRAKALFEQEYEKQYGHLSSDAIEISSVRVLLTAQGSELQLVERVEELHATDSKVGEREIIFDGAPYAVAVHSRDRLRTDKTMPGPGIVEEYGSTTFVPPHYSFHADKFRNLILERKP